MGTVAQPPALRYELRLHADAAMFREDRPSPRKPKLLDEVRQRIRARHYSRRTEKAYVHWIRRYILFHGKRHPLEMQ